MLLLLLFFTCFGWPPCARAARLRGDAVVAGEDVVVMVSPGWLEEDVDVEDSGGNNFNFAWWSRWSFGIRVALVWWIAVVEGSWGLRVSVRPYRRSGGTWR